MTKSSPAASSSGLSFVARVLIVTAIAVIVLAFWRISSVFMLGFGAIVVAVALDHIASPLARRFGLPHGLALLLAVLGLTVIFIVFFVLFGAGAASQFAELIQQLPAPRSRTLPAGFRPVRGSSRPRM